MRGEGEEKKRKLRERGGELAPKGKGGPGETIGEPRGNMRVSPWEVERNDSKELNKKE